MAISKLVVADADGDVVDYSNRKLATRQSVTDLITAIALLAPKANPTFSGTVSGVTKAHVGLSNVDNTSDTGKPISTATAAALATKPTLVSGKLPYALLPASDGTTATDNLWSSQKINDWIETRINTRVAEIQAASGTGGGGTSPFGAKFVNVVTKGMVAGTGADPAANYTALLAARSEAGIGGTLIFPASTEDYYINHWFKPWDGQTLNFAANTKYVWNAYHKGGGLRASASFTGPGVIYNDNSTPPGPTGSNRTVTGVLIDNGLLIGNGESGAVDGIDFGPVSGPERGWVLKNCQFLYCGTAMSGYQWVVSSFGHHMSRCGYGISPQRGADTNSRIQDSLYADGYIYFNEHHGIDIGGAVESGLAIFRNNRVERNGVQLTDVSGVSTMFPNANRDATACGILVTTGSSLIFLGNTSDANASNALRLDVLDNVNRHGKVNNIRSIGNTWKRDGTGDNDTTIIASVYCMGTLLCTLEDVITYGDPDDGSNVPADVRSAPQVGLEYLNNDFLTWHGTVQMDKTQDRSGNQILSANNNIKANAYKNGGGNYRCMITDTRSNIFSIPYVPTADLPNPLQGSVLVAWDTSSGQGLKASVNGAAWGLVATGGTGSTSSPSVVALSQSAYDALATKDPAVAYYVQAPGNIRRIYQSGLLFSEFVATFAGLRNSLAGVSSGTTITAANSGGTSGDAFSLIAGAVVAQDSADLTGVSGDRGFTASLAASTGAYVGWTHTDYSSGGWVRIYVRFGSTVTVAQRVARGFGSDAAIRWEIRRQPDNTIVAANFAGEFLASMATAVALNTVYRIELNPITRDLRVYAGDSLTVYAAPTAQPGLPTAGDWVSTRFGLFTTAAQTMSIDLAAPAVSSTGPIGLA